MTGFASVVVVATMVGVFTVILSETGEMIGTIGVVDIIGVADITGVTVVTDFLGMVLGIGNEHDACVPPSTPRQLHR